jgi:hypothetical protein
MADNANDGAIRISGRFGELFIQKRAAGNGPPVGIKLMEAESIEATAETAVEDIVLPGTGETGDKDGPTTRSGTLTVQHITTEWQNYHKRTALAGTLQARRRARDRGQRLDRSMTLQVWNDDPSALAAEGWQLVRVRFFRLTIGFTQDAALSREQPFRYGDEEEIRGFQRMGGQLDPVTGLPAIEYTSGQPSA